MNRKTLGPTNGAQWRQLTRWGHPSQKPSDYQVLSSSREGGLLVSMERKGDERLRWGRWADKPGEGLEGELCVPGGLTALALPDGSGFVAGDMDYNLSLHESRGGRELRRARTEVMPWRLASRPDGSLLAINNLSGNLLLWDVAHWRATVALKGPECYVVDMAFSPDGVLLAAAGKNGRTVIWDTRSGRVFRTLELEAGDHCLGVDFHPDGRILAMTTWGPLIHLFDVQDGRLLKTLNGPASGASKVTFNPEGDLLVVNRFGFLALSVADGSRVFRNEVDNDFYWSNVVFSPDGTLLAWGEPDGTVGIWGLESGA